MYIGPLNTYISHVLSLCTANGGQPRTLGVTIYLQDSSCPSVRSFPTSEGAPTNVWVAHSWGLPVPLKYVSIFLRHCGTFTGFIPYLKKDSRNKRQP